MILEKFAEFRDIKMGQELDMKNNCYICSLGKDTINKLKTPFEYHIEHVHNKLYYI